jgi:hypothetical protein
LGTFPAKALGRPAEQGLDLAKQAGELDRLGHTSPRIFPVRVALNLLQYPHGARTSMR